jgi:hypothetical protein
MCCFCISVVKDTGKGVEEEWERFDFNKDAPLDGDAQQDYFGGKNSFHDFSMGIVSQCSELIFTFCASIISPCVISVSLEAKTGGYCT